MQRVSTNKYYLQVFDCIKTAFRLKKTFCGKERKDKFSTDRNEKFSEVNFHFLCLALLLPIRM